MSSDDIAYYRERARTERRRAADAPTAEIAAVHAKLAGLYEALTDRLDQSRADQDVAPILHIAPQSRADRPQ